MSWTLIESQTLGSSVASVTLGSGGTLPQTYKTLRLVVSVRGDRAATETTFKFDVNGSASNISVRRLAGNGSSTWSDSYTQNVPGYMPCANSTTNTFGNIALEFPNYTLSSSKPISFDGVTENNASGAYQTLTASLWASSSAITSISIYADTSNLVTGSTFTLYGLK